MQPIDASGDVVRSVTTGDVVLSHWTQRYPRWAAAGNEQLL